MKNQTGLTGFSGFRNRVNPVNPVQSSSWLEDCFPTPHRTANSAIIAAEPFSAAGLQLSAVQSANAIATTTPENGWYLVSPYGEFPSPDRRYVQVFQREQAEEIVRSWNSLTGKAFRWMKNVRHKLNPSFTAPVFDASELGLHPDLDPNDWSKLQELARVQDLRIANSGLEALIEWDLAGMATRGPGPLKPSVNWWHNTPNAEGKVFPAHFESIVLTPFPNITSVPAWTPNSTQSNPMNPEQLKALCKAFNVPETTDPAKVIETAQSAYQLSTSNATALQTANTANTELENKLATANTDLTTANGKVTALTTERDNLSTANSTLVDGLLDVFELQGKFTAAERKDVKAKFTANIAGAAAVITELKEKKPSLNTQHLEIAGNRIDISTANARKQVIDAEVSRLMREEKLEHSDAWARVQIDPKFAGVFAAMQDPTRDKQAA